MKNDQNAKPKAEQVWRPKGRRVVQVWRVTGELDGWADLLIM